VELTHNAGEVAGRLEEAGRRLGELEETNAAAGRLALEAIDHETPRRTGTLAAGARCVADSFGFAYVNATLYAGYVDSYQGFATDTMRKQEAAIVAVYEDHNREALSALT
jgi:hypothetical protein